MCDICGKIVHTLNTFSKHKKSVHGVKRVRNPQECTICHNWYKDLLQHMRNIHADYSDKPNVCEICGFVSTTRVAKLKHIRYKHAIEKKYQCAVCRKAFKVPTLLKVSFVLKVLFMYVLAFEFTR